MVAVMRNRDIGGTDSVAERESYSRLLRERHETHEKEDTFLFLRAEMALEHMDGMRRLAEMGDEIMRESAREILMFGFIEYFGKKIWNRFFDNRGSIEASRQLELSRIHEQQAQEGDYSLMVLTAE